MTIDFEQIATLARERDKAKAEEERRQRDNEYEERLHRTQAGIKQLDAGIVPLLENAKQAFEKEGIPCVIRSDYDVVNYINRLPSVIFQCVGPKKKNRSGGESEPKSVPVFVSSDGDQVEVGLGDSHFARYPKKTLARAGVGEIEESIAKALETAVSSYFSEIAELRNSNLWD